jgi:hypothetical protein
MPTKRSSRDKSVWRRHSLSLVVAGILLAWVVLYAMSDPDKHWGSFFGNAIADWSGLLIIIITTKFLYEKGSKESRQPEQAEPGSLPGFLRRHSLSLFFIVTGLGWIYVFKEMRPTSKWGQVVGNLLSEWTQILGVILLTKKFFEVRSKE